MKSILLLCSLFFCTNGYSQEGVIGSINSTNEVYTDTTINGWKVKVNDRLREDHQLITKEAETYLTAELASIEKLLPSKAVPYLKEMPIWLEFQTPDNQPIQYHNSAKWLVRNGYDPKKESALEIVVTDYASMPHDSLPILRQICYAYQHRVLGLRNHEIEDAYKHAQSAEIYLVSGGSRQFFPFKSRLDYFSSISTAYFTDVSYPPYNRNKLKEIDPHGFELVEKLWKVKG